MPLTNIKSKEDNNILVNIVIPIYNSARLLDDSINKLSAFLDTKFSYNYVITIVDNGSTDASWLKAQNLAKKYPKVQAVHLKQKGRGRALKYAWSHSDADILAYMDVDLSTDLMALEPMIKALVNDRFSIATGSRLKRESIVKRSLVREIISRMYNYLLRIVLDLKTSDAQCGFKAIKLKTAKQILPTIKDNDWFFDTELLVKAEYANMAIYEIAVTWNEDPNSSVKIIKTAINNLLGIRRVKSELNYRPKWEKRTIYSILILAGVLYTIGMTKNGYANNYYAAAVQSGTHSWKAFFFGSLDSANFITVDKPPLFLWVMETSTRIFGFHPWSMLLPNVLAGVATVGLVYVTVRRWFSGISALIAAGIMAITPVAVMMFGFNNPDALLTLLLTASMYAFIRAIEGKRPLLWLSIMGILSGLAFNTKMLQGLIVLPILVIVYLFGASESFRSRTKNLLIAAISTAIVGLLWTLIVYIIPVLDRPYIGSSGDNNIWSLIFGYNGLGRLKGTNNGLGRIAETGVKEPTSILRIFNSSFGPDIAWFIAWALIGAVLIIWLSRHKKRTDKVRLAGMAWAGWLIIHIIIFSSAKGTIHDYYSIVMAPAIAALVGISLPIMFDEYRRSTRLAFILPLSVAITGISICILFGHYPTWFPWLRWLILDLAVLGAAGLLLNLAEHKHKIFVGSLIASLVACLVPVIIFSIATVEAGHIGITPIVGPSNTPVQTPSNETSKSQMALVNYLLRNRNGAKWILAVGSSIDSAPIQIYSGQPVMALGGFDGSDNSITLVQFKRLINSGQLRYYAVSNISTNLGSYNKIIYNWVQSNSPKISYRGDGFTVYYLNPSNI